MGNKLYEWATFCGADDKSETRKWAAWTSQCNNGLPVISVEVLNSISTE